MILQCDSGHLYGELVACAKYRIMDECIKNRKRQTLAITNVLVIIHLPIQARLSSFVGFQGDSWISVHIDDLLPDDNLCGVSPEQMAPISISKLFCVSSIHQSEPPIVMPHVQLDGNMSIPAHQTRVPANLISHQQQYWRLHKNIQAAVSRLYDDKGARRGLERILILEKLLPDGTVEIG